MSGFDRLLCYLRAISRNNSDQGTRFEHLMKKFFLLVLIFLQNLNLLLQVEILF